MQEEVVKAKWIIARGTTDRTTVNRRDPTRYTAGTGCVGDGTVLLGTENLVSGRLQVSDSSEAYCSATNAFLAGKGNMVLQGGQGVAVISPL